MTGPISNRPRSWPKPVTSSTTVGPHPYWAGSCFSGPLRPALRPVVHRNSRLHAACGPGHRLPYAAHFGPRGGELPQCHHRHSDPCSQSALSASGGQLHERYPGALLCRAVCLCLPAGAASQTDRSMLAWLAFAALSNALDGNVRQFVWLGVLVMVPCAIWLLRRRLACRCRGRPGLPCLRDHHLRNPSLVQPPALLAPDSGFCPARASSIITI